MQEIGRLRDACHFSAADRAQLVVNSVVDLRRKEMDACVSHQKRGAARVIALEAAGSPPDAVLAVVVSPLEEVQRNGRAGHRKVLHVRAVPAALTRERLSGHDAVRQPVFDLCKGRALGVTAEHARVIGRVIARVIARVIGRGIGPESFPCDPSERDSRTTKAFLAQPLPARSSGTN